VFVHGSILYLAYKYARISKNVMQMFFHRLLPDPEDSGCCCEEEGHGKGCQEKVNYLAWHGASCLVLSSAIRQLLGRLLARL
jgi:hypothetical protein